MRIKLIFRNPCLVPYALICAYGLFALTNPPQPAVPQPDGSPAMVESALTTPTAEPVTNHFADLRVVNSQPAETR